DHSIGNINADCAAVMTRKRHQATPDPTTEVYHRSSFMTGSKQIELLDHSRDVLLAGRIKLGVTLGVHFTEAITGIGKHPKEWINRSETSPDLVRVSRHHGHPDLFRHLTL